MLANNLMKIAELSVKRATRRYQSCRPSGYAKKHAKKGGKSAPWPRTYAQFIGSTYT